MRYSKNIIVADLQLKIELANRKLIKLNMEEDKLFLRWEDIERKLNDAMVNTQKQTDYIKSLKLKLSHARKRKTKKQNKQ